MPKFTSETAKKAGAKSRRGKSLKGIILEKTHNGNDIVNMLLKIVKSKSPKVPNKDKIAAAKMLLEYGVGRPVQSVDANIDGAITFSWEDLPSE